MPGPASVKKLRTSSENLLVTIATGSGCEIKISKDVLIKSSPVIRSLLSNDNGKDNKLMVPKIANVDIHDCDMISFFDKIIQSQSDFGGATITWDATSAMRIYGWAHYYQVNFIKIEVLDTIENYVTKTPMMAQAILIIYNFVTQFKLSVLESKLLNQKLNFNCDDYINFFNLAIKIKNDHFMFQVLDYIINSRIEPEDDWPIILSKTVHKRMAKKLENVQLELQNVQVELREVKEQVANCSNCSISQ